MNYDDLFRETACVRIKKGTGRTLKAGGAWIYDNEIDTISGDFENGDLVTVEDFDGYPLGHGFINTRSKLTVRMLSRKKDTVVNEDFIEQRVRTAWEYRKATTDISSCRVIFGEADFLPGIVIDKFEDVLVVESLALGIDRLKPVILDKLKKVLAEDGILIRGIYERSDAKVRLQEGMERFKGFIGEPFDTKVEICENGVHYIVDVEDGQKTGFFLDQKYNRLAVQNLCRNLKPAKVLDCFTHTGAFALNAAKGGAASVTAVDISQEAVDMTKKNAEANNLDIDVVKADVFDYLVKLDQEHNHDFDYIILDPPAFTKSGKTVHEAFRGYKEINYRAMKILPRGGYLATCSCSHFMGEELFVKMVKEAARDAGVTLRQIEFRQQAPDHPILMTVPETYYLKFFLFQIV